MQNVVYQFKEMVLQHQTTTLKGKVQLYTDSTPGADLTDQTAGGKDLNTSSGPVEVTIPLDGIEGTSYYVKVTPGATGITRVFKGHIKVRPIGVYLSGANGDIFQTRPAPIGA